MNECAAYQVVDERGEAGEFRVAEGVVPEGEAHDACGNVYIYIFCGLIRVDC